MENATKDSPGGREPGCSNPQNTVLSFIKILVYVYIFLLSVKLLSQCFKGLGSDFAETLMSATDNRFFGLFIGIICTSIVQSSSVTTSLAVSMVAGNVMSLDHAIPVIMGANIGTAITNTLVSLGHISRKEEFERAFSAALVHDLFNLLSVFILFPLEMATGVLKYSAQWLTAVFYGGVEGGKFNGPLEIIVKPVVRAIQQGVADILNVPPDNTWLMIGLIVLGFTAMILTLLLISKCMRTLALGKLEKFFGAFVFKSIGLSFLVGLVFTFILQSSSVTTSLMIPLAAAGIVNVNQLFPYVIGANMGTTGTAIFAALAGHPIGLTLAFVHLLFNIFGSILIYPIRVVPLGLAREFGKRAARSKKFAFIYIAVTYFVIPGIMILINELTKQ